VAPAPVALLGVLVLGPVHVLFELRYVVAVTPALRRGRLAGAVQVAALAAGAARLVRLPRWPEMAVLVALLGLVAWRRRAVVAVATVAVALVVARWPAWSIVMVAHAHNLVPVAVLVRRTGRTLAVALGGAYAAIVAVVLGGLVPVPALGGAASRAAAVVTPPVLAHGDAPARWLVLFGSAQLVHYGLWCWYLPRYHDAPWRAAAEPVVRHATAAWLVAIGGVAALGLLVTAAVATGASARSLYQAAAAYHVVVEAPALMALLGRSAPARAPRRRPPARASVPIAG